MYDGFQSPTVPILYFAYGSNMDPEQLRQRCPDPVAQPFRAKAIGWRLHFPRYAEQRRCGVASIEQVWEEEGAARDRVWNKQPAVWGVVYTLTLNNWKALNLCEDFDPERPCSQNTYYWRSLAVYPDDPTREPVAVGTYVAHLDQETLPSKDYLNQIISGARQQELDHDYVRDLEAIREAIDPDPDELDVAIVGGGIAGLYCAYQLLYKRKFRLYEATNHPGGRIWSTRILDGKYDPNLKYRHESDIDRLDFCAEFGPMRIELDQQKLLGELLKALNIQDFEPFPPYQSPISKGDPTYELQGEEAEQKTPMDLLMLAFARVLGRLIDPPRCVVKGLDYLSRAAATRQADWKEALRQWVNELEEPDYQVLRELAVFDDGTGPNPKTGGMRGTPLHQMGFWNLLSEVLSHHAVMKVRDLGTFYHLLAENPNAAEWLIFWLRGLKTSQHMVGIRGGMQRISEELIKRIPADWFIRESRLTRILTDAGNANAVSLEFTGNGAPAHPVVSRHVILALPKAPLEEVVATNASSFSREVCDNIDSVFGFPMAKLFVVVRKRWWQEDDARWTNRFATLVPTRELHYLRSKRKGSEMGMVLVYTDRPASAFLANYVTKTGAQEEPEWGYENNRSPRLVKKAVEYLKQTGYANIRDEDIVCHAIRDWGRKPYSAANHAWRPERQSWKTLARLSRFALLPGQANQQENVHICGEAYSDYHGFIEGALRSAAHVLHGIYEADFDSPTPWLCDPKKCNHPRGLDLGSGGPTMTKCWACSQGIASVVTIQVPTQPGAKFSDPLGSCWECGVFGCSNHAERDRKTGKWLCFSSVATLLSISARLDDADQFTTSLRFENGADFRRRLPALAEATEGRRAYWQGRRKGLEEEVRKFALSAAVNSELLAEAIGVADSINVDAGTIGREQKPVGPPTPTASPAVPGRLGQLLASMR